MKIDIITHIGAITRGVSTREREGREAQVVTATRTYPTSVEDLWDAITNPERLPRWFMPISGELRLGGRYQLEGNAGGEITRCEPPQALAVTWEYGGGVSWLDVQLAAVEGGAELRLEHTAWPEAHWEQFGPGAVGIGWDLALMGLGEHLRTGAATTAQEGLEWTTSEEGKAFMRQSSARWGEAHIRGGADPDAARAAAARTFAAYTGEAPGDDADDAGSGG